MKWKITYELEHHFGARRKGHILYSFSNKLRSETPILSIRLIITLGVPLISYSTHHQHEPHPPLDSTCHSL